MQLAEIPTNDSGRELTERGTPLFPISLHDNDMFAFPSQHVPWHWHEECEIVRVCTGEMLLEVPGAEIILAGGDGAFIRSNALHAMRPHGTAVCRMITIVFAPDIVGGASSSIFHSRYVLPLIQDEAVSAIPLRTADKWGQQALDAVRQAEEVLSGCSFGYELQVRNILSAFWLLVLENSNAESVSEGNVPDPYLRQLLAFIHANYASELSLEDIARSAGISVRTCSRSFRQRLQMSVFDYLLEYRIRKAAEKLLLTNDPVTEICFASGFRDPSYFTRRFHAATGMSPREYRRAVRKTAEQSE